MWSWSTYQRHRQMDGRTCRQTTCDRKTALCTIVHCAVIKLSIIPMTHVPETGAINWLSFFSGADFCYVYQWYIRPRRSTAINDSAPLQNRVWLTNCLWPATTGLGAHWKFSSGAKSRHLLLLPFAVSVTRYFFSIFPLLRDNSHIKIKLRLKTVIRSLSDSLYGQRIASLSSIATSWDGQLPLPLLDHASGARTHTNC